MVFTKWPPYAVGQPHSGARSTDMDRQMAAHFWQRPPPPPEPMGMLGRTGVAARETGELGVPGAGGLVAAR